MDFQDGLSAHMAIPGSPAIGPTQSVPLSNTDSRIHHIQSLTLQRDATRSITIVGGPRDLHLLRAPLAEGRANT